MLSALLTAVLLALTPARAAAQPAADESWAAINTLRASTWPYDGSLMLWRVAPEFPDHLEMQAAYSEERVANGYYETTLEHHQNLYEKNPSAENAYLFARIDYDEPRARGTVERALRAGSKLPGLLWLKTLHRAEDLAASGKHEAALAMIEASTGVPAVDAATIVKGRVSLLMAMGRLDEAGEATEAAWERHWSDPGLHSLRIGVAYHRGDLGTARALADNTPGATTYAYALFMKGSYLAAMGKKIEAREWWKRVLESPRDYYDWDEVRMHALSSLDDLEGASRQAVAVLALDPASAGAQVQLASYALATGSVPEGERMARAALAKNPRSVGALALMASINFRHGRYRDALELYDRALAIVPGATELWVARAAVHSHMGARDLQRKSMERAAKVNDANPYYLREMGRMHMDASEWAAALSYYKHLLTQDEPGLEEVRGYARSSVGVNLLEQGLAGFARALELAQTPEERKRVKADIAWANGYLTEASERYARDAAAKVEKVSVRGYLDAAPTAAYLEHRRLVVGTPWRPPLARWTTEGGAALQTAWAPGGNGLYALVDNRIDFLDLKTGATHTVLAEMPQSTARSDAFPASRVLRSFALSPDGKRMSVLAQDLKRGRSHSDVLLDYNAFDSKPREAARRDLMDRMFPDPLTGRLLISGGGNMRVDLTAGTTEEFPIVGCTITDVAYSPGGERMACVALDAKGPETNEVILYDIATRKKVPLEIAGRGPAWSPDGQRLAYVWRGRQLRVLELKTSKVTAYELGHELDHFSLYPAEGGKGTRWSPDGRFIFFHLGPEKGKRNEPRAVIVDRTEKTAWTHAGPLDAFEWAPSLKP